MMQTLSFKSPPMGGLSQLVEAASTLSKLDELPMQSKPAQAPPSVISDDDDSSSATSSQSSNSYSSASSKPTTSASKEIFPQRLMAILSDPQISDVISWLPHGRSFVILRPEAFAERVLPKYLPPDNKKSTTTTPTTKYPSFTRKLNRWGFRQATRGADTGAFFHPLFRRDEPELCLDMVCQKSRKGKNSGNSTCTSETSKKTTNEDAKDSNDNKEFTSTRLPVKKRKMQPSSDESNATTSLPSVVVSKKQQQFLQPDTSSVVSNDDRSVSSNDNDLSHPQLAAAASQTPTPLPPLLALAPAAASLLLAAATPTTALALQSSLLASACVPTDPQMVAGVLQKRDEMERLAAAKLMLHDAYTKAVNNLQ